MVFRNVILNKLLNADPERNIKRAVIISSILFALFHLDNLTVAASRPVAISTQVIYSGLMGVFFAAAYLKTKTLLGPIIVHSFIDFMSALPELFSTASGVENSNIPDINIISALITIAVVIPCFIKGVKIIKNLPKSDVDIIEA